MALASVLIEWLTAEMWWPTASRFVRLWFIGRWVVLGYRRGSVEQQVGEERGRRTGGEGRCELAGRSWQRRCELAAGCRGVVLAAPMRD
ncbi:hypothetical protein LINPERHAP1_LOCUS30628 [Linum perenne]